MSRSRPYVDCILQTSKNGKGKTIVEAARSQRPFDGADYNHSSELKEKRDAQVSVILETLKAVNPPPKNKQERENMIQRFASVYKDIADEIINEISAALSECTPKINPETIKKQAREAVTNYLFNMLKNEPRINQALTPSVEFFLNDLSNCFDKGNPIEAFDKKYTERLETKISKFPVAVTYMNMVEPDYFREKLAASQKAREAFAGVLAQTNVDEEKNALEQRIKDRTKEVHRLKSTPTLLMREKNRIQLAKKTAAEEVALISDTMTLQQLNDLPKLRKLVTELPKIGQGAQSRESANVSPPETPPAAMPQQQNQQASPSPQRERRGAIVVKDQKELSYLALTAERASIRHKLQETTAENLDGKENKQSNIINNAKKILAIYDDIKKIESENPNAAELKELYQLFHKKMFKEVLGLDSTTRSIHNKEVLVSANLYDTCMDALKDVRKKIPKKSLQEHIDSYAHNIMDRIEKLNEADQAVFLGKLETLFKNNPNRDTQLLHAIARLSTEVSQKFSSHMHSIPDEPAPESPESRGKLKI